MMAVVGAGVSARIEEAVMRRCLVVLCLLGLSGLVTPTNAQDFDVPTLRGTSPYIAAPPRHTRWAGFYFGGQIGRSSSEMDFKDATEGQLAFLLRELAVEAEHHPSRWQVLGKANPSGVSYGAFAGYNTQWSDVIVGVDVHYNRTSNFFANAPVTPIARSVSAAGLGYIVNITGAASMRITDYGAARVRGGWIVGNFLPYATLGVAVGRADITRSSRVDLTEEGVPFSFSASETKNGHFIYGWSAGGGVDILVMPNVFVRAEFEYIGFTEAQGIKADIGTARVGAGVRF
jgi:opacity protein-like surface antigen